LKADGIAAARAGHDYSLKKVIAPFAVKTTRFHTTVFESGGRIHKYTDRSVPVFPAIPFRRG
jgi:hypothetical protein